MKDANHDHGDHALPRWRAIELAEARMREACGEPGELIELRSIPGRDIWLIAQSVGDPYRPAWVAIGETDGCGLSKVGEPEFVTAGWGDIVEKIEREASRDWPKLSDITEDRAACWLAMCREIVGGDHVRLVPHSPVPPGVALHCPRDGVLPDVWPTEEYVRCWADYDHGRLDRRVGVVPPRSL